MNVPARFLTLCVALPPWASATLVAQAPVHPTLLVDLNREAATEPGDSDPRILTGAAGDVWFALDTPALGTELWETDGTAAGTQVVEDFASGSDTAFGGAAARLPDGTLILTATGFGRGNEPWARPAGSTSVVPLGDLTPGPGSSQIPTIEVVGTTAWIPVSTANGIALWRTDGTPGGTVLDEVIPGVGAARCIATSGQLWILPAPSTPRLTLVKHRPGSPAVAVAPSNDFRARDVLGEVAGGVILTATTYLHGLEPWFSDGTSLGTRLLADISPGRDPSNVRRLAAGQGRLWMAATAPSTGSELWVTDGTPAGTRLVRDVNPGVAYGLGPGAAIVPGGLVFTGLTRETGFEPWFSDGTTAGTRLLRDVFPGPTGSAPRSFVEHAGRVWFGATSGSDDDALWVSDGTTLGTVAASDLRPGPGLADPRPLAVTRHGLLLRGDDGSGAGAEPWVLDENTFRVVSLGNLTPDATTRSSEPELRGIHDARALLHASTGSGPRWLFVTDATASGTTQALPYGSPNAPEFVAPTPDGFLIERSFELWSILGEVPVSRRLAGSQFFPLAPDAPLFRGATWFNVLWNGSQAVWSSDGTIAGTGPAASMAGRSSFFPLATCGALLFGSDGAAATGREPWISDGTAGGTRLLVDISPGPTSSSPELMVETPDGVFFRASDGTHGYEPWFSDGTPAGTTALGDLTPGRSGSWPHEAVRIGAHGAVFLTVDAQLDQELWASDGTPAGTWRVHRMVAGPPARRVESLVGSGELAFFRVVSDDPQDGVELWTTGQVPGSTRLVLSFPSSGPRMSTDSPLVAVNDFGLVAFAAWDAVFGQELWMSDGTPAGTRVVADAHQGSADGTLSALGRVRDKFLFVADDGSTGVELHALRIDAFGIPSAAPVGRGCGAHLAVDAAPRIAAPFGLTIEASRSGSHPLGLVLGVAPAFGSPTPDCEMNVANPTAIGVAITDPAGRLALPVALPNDRNLVGMRLYLQAALAVPGGGLFGTVETTPALELVIGR